MTFSDLIITVGLLICSYCICEGTLLIESCVELIYIDFTSAGDFPSSGTLQVSIWIDNDVTTLRNSSIYTSGDLDVTRLNFNAGETFCYEFDTNGIDYTGFKADYARRVQIVINDDILEGYLVLDFSGPRNEGQNSYLRYNTELLSTSNTMTMRVALYNQASANYLKISNRNHMYNRECFQLYQICFYEADVTASSSQCNIYGSISEARPSEVDISSNLGDSSTATTWPHDGNLTGSADKCWEPYQEYVTIDISSIKFGSIGIGFIGTGFSSGYWNGTSTEPPAYFSFSFIDTLSDNVSDWQHWAINFDDLTEVSSSASDMFYAVNPLSLLRDSDPIADNNRFSGITSGIPEVYSVNVNLPYNTAGSTTTEFTTWTLWIMDLSSAFVSDGNDLQMGQLARVTCRNIFGDNSTYTGTVLSLQTYKDDDSRTCWGAGTSCGVNGPPMRYAAAPGDVTDAFCDNNGIDSTFINWGQCQANAPTDPAVTVYDCDVSTSACDGNVDSGGYIMTAFSCNEETQITSIMPSPYPSMNPTMAPSNAPSKAPSFMPSNEPTNVPTYEPAIVPTVMPSNKPSGVPSSQPSSQPSAMPSKQPSNQPSAQPSNRPSGTPSEMPSALPSMLPTNTPTEEPTSFNATKSAVIGGNDDGPELFFEKYLWYIIGATILLLLCCIIIVVLIATRCKRKKEARNFGNADVVKQEMEMQGGLPRPLSTSDQLGPERIPAEKLNPADMGDEDEEDIYGGPNATDGDPAVTGYGKQTTEGEDLETPMDRRNSEGGALEGGDPAVTGQPTDQGSTPNGQAIHLLASASPSMDPVLRPSVASDASDVFSSPEEAAMNQIRNNQVYATDAGPDQALEVLMENQNEDVGGLTKGGPDEPQLQHGHSQGASSFGTQSNRSVGGLHEQQNSQQTTLEYGSDGKDVRFSVHSNGDNASIRSGDTLIGMTSDGDGDGNGDGEYMSPM